MCRADSASLSVGDGSAATLSVAASGLAVFVWLAYWLARVGFSTALLGSSVTTLGVSLFVLNSPAVADLLAGRTNVRSTEWYASPSASILFALVVCQLAGFAPSVWAGFFGIVLAVLGFALFALNAANLVRFPILQWSLSAGLGYVLMLVTLTVGMWGMGYQSPVFVEGLATGAVHQDTLFHADVCAMIGTLGYPTTGVDGAPVLHYHAGSNYLMSAMSRLTGLPPVEVYQLGFQVLIPPLLVAALLLVGFRLASVLKLPRFDHRILARSPWPWLVVAVVLGGVALPFDGGRNLLWLLPWTQMSESHGVGVALMFLWADLLLQVPGVLRKASMRAVMLLLFVVVPLMAAWMGYAKSSVLSVALPVVVYAVVRLRGYRDWRVLVSVILSGGAALATMMAMASTASRYPIDFGSLLKMMVSRTPFSASLAVLGFIAGHYPLTARTQASTIAPAV